MTPGAGRFVSVPFASLAALFGAASLLFLAACGDDDPPGRTEPEVIYVTSAEELAAALESPVAGDTIQIDGGFSNPEFEMDRGFVLDGDSSPIHIRSNPRASFRPTIVFPANVDGLRFNGHDGSTVKFLEFRGGRNTVVLDNSNVRLDSLIITDPDQDGVEAFGAGTTGRVHGCLIEFVPAGQGGHGGRFGVSTTSGTRLTIEQNTIVEAGDCGLYIGSNDVIRANNIVRAHNFGIFFDGNADTPVVTCNNAFMSVNANYQPATAADPETNFQVDPRFCAGSYRLQDISPLAPINSGGCGLIGSQPVEDGCTVPAE